MVRARASSGGAARAVAAGLRDLEHVVSVADGHSLANARRTADEALADVAERVHEVDGVCEVILAVAWGCPFDGPTPVARTAAAAARAVELGADRLCLGDTIGTASPARVVALLQAVRVEAGDVPVGMHFHDTRGMGMANALAAVQAGVTMMDASVAAEVVGHELPSGLLHADGRSVPRPRPRSAADR